MPDIVSKKRFAWLDALKGIAILAVICDHAMVMLHQVIGPLWHQTHFAVPWFMAIAGYTSTMSLTNSKENGLKKYVGYYLRRLSLIVWYCIAAYIIPRWVPEVSTMGLTDPTIRFLLFDNAPHFYFFYIFFQLLAIAPLLYLITRYRNVVYRISIILLICIVGYWLSLVNQKPYFFFPWHMLLGGMYLPVFVIGMMAYRTKLSPFLPAAIIIYVLTEFLALTRPAILFSVLPNPFMMCWSISFLVIMAYILQMLPEKLLLPVSYFGRTSVTIFLFHFSLLKVLFARAWFPQTVIPAVLVAAVATSIPEGGVLFFASLPC